MPAETPTSPLASMPQQLADSGQPQEPIRLQLGSSRLREERVGAGGTRTGDETQAQGQRGPNSHPGTMRSKPDDKGTPAEWPRRRKRGRCLITFIVALLVPVMFALLALNVSGLGSAFGGILQHPTATHRPTATTATPTTAPTVTPAPTYTAAPQSTATPSQQQILNQQAYASFRSVVLGTFSDGTCSSANARSSFSRNQAIYINLCTSSKAVSAPMTITIRQGGKVVYTWAYGYYISPSASYYFVTSHGFSPGTYDVQVTLKISGTTAVARDLALSIK